jgi:hypothetical protein
MNTCGDCRYFGEDVNVADEDFNYAPSGYHKCTLIKHGNAGVYCSGDLMKESGHGALVEDYSGAYAALIVESDFGCVKWEKKDG